MICIARTFGAPETVPAGKHARSRSRCETSGSSSPTTSETRCVTCEKRSGSRNRASLTVPGRQTRERSLRPRSTSITCSARSFSEESSRSASPSPGRVVPAIGFSDASRPSALTSVSGEEPTRARPSSSSRKRYGDGFTRRSERYSSRALADVGRSARCERTIWKASPARMCSLACTTARSYARREGSRRVEPAHGQVAALVGERNSRLEPRDVVVPEVADDRETAGLGLVDVDDPRPAADERMPSQPSLLDGFEQEARAAAGAQPEVGPEGGEEVGGDDGQCVHSDKQKDPPSGRSASGTGLRLGQQATLPPRSVRQAQPQVRGARVICFQGRRT